MNFAELKFKIATLEKIPKRVRISDYEIVTDLNKFFSSHIDCLEKNPGNEDYLPFWDRLLKVYKLIEAGDTNVEY